MNFWKRLMWLFTGSNIEFVRVIRMTPGDVLLLETDKKLSDEENNKISKYVSKLIGERNNVMILDASWKVDLLRGYDTEAKGAEV